MKDLIVIDLDKTLIPFDSFRRYLFLWSQYYPVLIFKLLFLRKFRLLSLSDFKNQFIANISKHKFYDKINEEFAISLVKAINKDIIKIVSEKSKKDCIVLLLSASSDDYVSIVAKLIEFEGQGSYFFKNNFFHLHGKGR